MFQEISLEDLDLKDLKRLSDDGGIDAAERKILLTQLLRIMTHREKKIIGLVLEGYTQQQIAMKLRISQGSISKIYHQAIERCRRRLSLGE